jgi:hypothetical protein
MADLTTNLNYLQPTSYKLVIDRENYPNLEYFAQTVTHPGMILNPSEVPFRKIQGVPIVGGSLTFNELSVTIILDEDMTAYNEMYQWIRRVVDNLPVSALDRGASQPPTYSDITLSILSSQNNVTKTVKYLECCPTALGDIQFESTASGTEFITFTVSFRFTYFEFV